MELNKSLLKSLNLLLALIWFGLLISGGVHLFSKGFLLSRIAQTEYSSCTGSVSENCDAHNEKLCLNDKNIASLLKDVNGSYDVCLPKKKKVILLVIDALKYDFGVFNSSNESPLPFENKLPILNELMISQPNNSRLMKFHADPPTTTLQRLKGLTTGSLPTFIDIGSNFATAEINEDNLIDQVVRNNLTAVFMGDSTWTDLFPKRFKRSFPFPSFDIFDLDTVDRGIESILSNELAKPDWDLFIAHFLGVDHCGHRHGPLHKEMARKLTEMNQMITNVVNQIDNDTLLFVFGDHGMTVTGDHGGDSPEETIALLFGYSKNDPFVPVEFAEDASEMQQIDLVPTLSTILGIPVPYSNLGSINLSLLPDIKVGSIPRFQTLLIALWHNAMQIHNYFHKYAFSNKGTFIEDELENLKHKFLVLTHRASSIYSEEALLSYSQDLHTHLNTILVMCRDVWVKFDANQMSQGLLIVFIATFFIYVCMNNTNPGSFQNMFTNNTIGFVYLLNAAIGVFAFKFYDQLGMNSSVHAVIMFCSMMSIVILAILTIQHWPEISDNWSEMKHFSNFTLRLIYGASVCVFFSNSYIVEEQKVLTFMIMGLFILFLYELKKMNVLLDARNRINLGSLLKSNYTRIFILGIFGMLLLRGSHYYFKCREEQGNCMDFQTAGKMTSSNGKRTKNQVSDLMPVIVLALFVTVSRIFLKTCGNLTGFSFSVMLARYGPTIGSICADGHFFLSRKKTSAVKQTYVDALAWVVYALFLIQLVVVVAKPLMLHIVPKRKDTINVPRYGNVVPEIFRKMKNMYASGNGPTSEDSAGVPIIYGLATAYSSVFVTFGVVLTIMLALLLGPSPSIGLIISVCVGIILVILGSVLRYESTSSFHLFLQPRFITIIAWHLLIHFTFFATSHQPTMSQIEWQSAFVGRSAKFDHSNYLSAVLVILNTFGGAFLLNVLYPLLIIGAFCIYAVFPSMINKKTVKGIKNKQKTSGNNEYRTVTVHKVDEDEEEYNFDITRGELVLFENENIFIESTFKLGCQFIMLQGFRIFCAMLACTIHCRHLMVWKVFAPRFIFEGVTTFVSLAAIPVGFIILIRIHSAVDRLITKIRKSV